MATTKETLDIPNMSRIQELSDDLRTLKMLEREIESLNVDCGATRDILARLGEAIRAINHELFRGRRHALIADATALLHVARNCGGLT